MFRYTTKINFDFCNKASMRNLFLLILFVFIFPFTVQAEEEEPKPLDPAYEGIHGMVLINNGSSLYASHLPLFHKPHDAQIIYKLDVSNNALIYLVRDADMVTIKPAKFNLQRLMRGESFSVKADVYIGHFERGGSLTYEQMDITFSELEYLRMIEKADKPVAKQVYDTVPINNGARLLVHQIQGVPTYDHIVLLYQNIGCLTEFYTTSPVPDKNRLLSKLSFCGSMKPLYYETDDFK